MASDVLMELVVRSEAMNSTILSHFASSSLTPSRSVPTCSPN